MKKIPAWFNDIQKIQAQIDDERDGLSIKRIKAQAKKIAQTGGGGGGGRRFC